MYGWMGKILRVNLSEGFLKSEPLDEDLRHKFIGGRGINSKILYDEVGSDTSPLSPQNLLIFGTSPLSATPAPSSSRCTVTAKSPLTGILGDANFGGFFGPELKLSGYDHLIITGKAEYPVYLFITNEKVEIKKANHIWGKTTWETEKILREEIGDKGIQIVSIGQAGENLVRTACIVHGYDVSSRTGVGAVMGSKNLKAIVVKGDGSVEIAKPKEFEEICKEIRKKIKESPSYFTYANYGMAGNLTMENSYGVLAIKNCMQTGEFPDAEKVSCETLAREFYTGSRSCYSCNVACMKTWEVKEGPFAGEKGTKMPEGCNSPCGPNCANTYAPSLFKIYNLCNQYGIDVLDFGITMGTLMEWYEKGMVTREETEGLSFEWGNYQSMIDMIPKIAKREGFGDLLADGAVRAGKKIGRGAERYVNQCKGMVHGGGDLRPLKGMALSHAVATRGNDHLRGLILIEALGNYLISDKEATERFGTAKVLNIGSYEKATAVVYYQDIYTLADCLQICKFVTSHNGHGVNISDMARLFYTVTGLEVDEKEMRSIAQRVYTIERCYSAREGMDKKDDFIQGRMGTEAVQTGPFKGERLERDKFEKMLENYYSLRGWDPNTGIPTINTLEELGLQEVAKELEKMGKYKK